MCRKVNTLHCCPGHPNLLASSCSDGTVHIWDIQKLTADAKQAAGSAAAPKLDNPKAAAAAAAETEDPKAAAGGGDSGGGDENKAFNGSSGSGSSSSSKKVKHPKPLCTLTHSKSSQGAYWAPDGSGRLLTISFDDTLRVWGTKEGGAVGVLEQKVSGRG